MKPKLQDPTALVTRARKTNKQRSEDERQSGLTTPEGRGKLLLLQTAKVALWCGMSVSDWNAVAEGYAMLETLEAVLQIEEEL